MKTSEGLAVGGNIFTYVFTALQPNEIFQIIQLILAILTSCVILAYKIYSWYKEAKKDGKITSDELKQIGKDSEEDLKNIAENIEEIKEITKKGEGDK